MNVGCVVPKRWPHACHHSASSWLGCDEPGASVICNPLWHKSVHFGQCLDNLWPPLLQKLLTANAAFLLLEGKSVVPTHTLRASSDRRPSSWTLWSPVSVSPEALWLGSLLWSHDRRFFSSRRWSAERRSPDAMSWPPCWCREQKEPERQNISSCRQQMFSWFCRGFSSLRVLNRTTSRCCWTVRDCADIFTVYRF